MWVNGFIWQRKETKTKTKITIKIFNIEIVCDQATTIKWWNNILIDGWKMQIKLICYDQLTDMSVIAV